MHSSHEEMTKDCSNEGGKNKKMLLVLNSTPSDYMVPERMREQNWTNYQVPCSLSNYVRDSIQIHVPFKRRGLFCR